MIETQTLPKTKYQAIIYEAQAQMAQLAKVVNDVR
jgi:hypothetical protein